MGMRPDRDPGRPRAAARAAGKGAALAGCLAALLLVSLSGNARAQTTSFEEPAEIVAPETVGEVGFAAGSVIVAPIPFESPLLGSGLALGGAYMFQFDDRSDSSWIGGGAFKTSNGSRGYAVGGNLSFARGTWSTKFIHVNADLTYDLYSKKRAFTVKQSVRGYSFELGRAISPETRLGVTLGHLETSFSRPGGVVLPPEYIPDSRIRLARLTFGLDHDRRDDNIYPRQGTLVRARLTYGRFLIGRQRDYTKAVVTARKYLPVGGQGILAGQAALCAASGSAPFLDACALGAADAFRGYVATEFIGDALASLQVEYRGRLTRRFGFVLFAGAGSVANDFADLPSSPLRTAGGVGLRIRLSRKFPVDYSVDLAANERGERLLYVSVGQRF